MHGSVDLRVEDWNDMGHGEVHSYFVDMDGVSSSSYEGDMKVRTPFSVCFCLPLLLILFLCRGVSCWSVSVFLDGEEGGTSKSTSTVLLFVYSEYVHNI